MYTVKKGYHEKIYDSNSTQSLIITVDGQKIDNKYIRNIELNDECFDSDNFTLGSACIGQITLTLSKEAITNLDTISEFYFQSIVPLENDEQVVPIGYYYAHPNDIDTKDEYTVKFVLKDKIFEMESGYTDFSEKVKSGNFTRRDLIEAICEKYDLTLTTPNFLNGDKQVGVFDNDISDKTWLIFVSERAGGFAKIIRGKELYIKSYGEVDTVEIPNTTLGNFSHGELKTITGVTYQNGIQKIIKGNSLDVMVYLSQDNYFACDEEEVQKIYESLNGVQFQTLDVKLWGDPSIDTGDIIKVNGYTSFCQKKWSYGNGFYGSYKSTLNIVGNSLDIKKVSVKQSQRRIYSRINEVEGKIEIVAEENSDTVSKVSSLNQTVNEIKGTISEVADVTKSGENIGRVILENINLSEPIYLKIHPTTDDIESSYLEENQYLDDNQYLMGRIVRFKNDNGYVVDYELPDDLLILDDVYDEFVLDYMAQECTVTKKIGWNSDGSKYLLSTPITKKYNYPKIILEEGDYTISLLSYITGYIFVRLMSKNIYTDQFATKVEMNSSITQTKESITSEVNKKLTGYSTTEEMNSAIIQKANEITQSVSKSYATKDQLNTAKSEIKQTTDLITSTVNSKVSTTDFDNKLKNYSTTTEMNSAITQKANSIILSVSSTFATKDQLNTAKTEIKQTTDSITSSVNSQFTTVNGNIKTLQGTVELKLNTKDLFTEFNVAVNKVVINADNFKLDAKGKITASSGTIGGWTLTTGKIYGGTAETGVAVMQMPSANINWVFAAGGTSHSDYGDCLFRVSKKGELFSTAGKIAGWSINTSGLSNGSYFIHNNGYSNIFTYADIVILRNYMLGKISFTDEDIKRYDLNSDGKIDSADLYEMRKKILNL